MLVVMILHCSPYLLSTEFNDGNSDIIPGSPLSQSSMQQQDYLEGIGEDPRESDEMDEDGGLPLADVDQGCWKRLDNDTHVSRVTFLCTLYDRH